MRGDESVEERGGGGQEDGLIASSTLTKRPCARLIFLHSLTQHTTLLLHDHNIYDTLSIFLKMVLQSELLTTAAAKPAGFIRRCTAGFRPLLLMSLMLFHGIVPALRQQLGNVASRPWKVLSPWAWRDAILGASMPLLLDVSDKGWAPIKQALLHEADGDVLEVGAGGGTTIKYYDVQQVSDTQA